MHAGICNMMVSLMTLVSLMSLSVRNEVRVAGDFNLHYITSDHIIITVIFTINDKRQRFLCRYVLTFDLNHALITHGSHKVHMITCTVVTW